LLANIETFPLQFKHVAHRLECRRGQSMKFARCVIVLVFGPALAGAEEIFREFRGKDVDDVLFRLQGPNAATRVKSEPEGLRITMPRDAKATTAGLATRFSVKGDFEIDVGYEILHREVPAAGSGQGLEIYLNTDTPTEKALVFYRIGRPKEGEVYMCDRKETVAGKRETVRRTFPTASQSGRLRLGRRGTEVTFAAAEAGSMDFQELCRYEWGEMDAGVAIRGWGSHSPVDLRITQVRIQDRREPAAVQSDAPPERSSWRLWLTAGLLGATLMAAGLLWVVRRRPRAVGTTKSDPIVFFCTHCGKHLRASAGSAGKSVKCLGCGRPTLVPDIAL
jgi:hypothetical protein